MLALQLGSAMPCRSSLLFGLLSVSQPLPSPAGYPPAPQINGIHIDCSPPGSSVHGILQARILEWVAISSSNA